LISTQLIFHDKEQIINKSNGSNNTNTQNAKENALIHYWSIFKPHLNRHNQNTKIVQSLEKKSHSITV